MKTYENTNVIKTMTYECVSYAFLRLFIRGVGIGIIYSIIPISYGNRKKRIIWEVRRQILGHALGRSKVQKGQGSFGIPVQCVATLMHPSGWACH